MIARRLLGPVAVVAILAAGGCASLQQTAPAAVATISADILPPGDLSLIETGCSAATPLLTAASSAKAPAAVSGAAAFFASYCQQLAAAPAGQVPASTTTTTYSWLQTGLQALQVAATAAALL